MMRWDGVGWDSGARQAATDFAGRMGREKVVMREELQMVNK